MIIDNPNTAPANPTMQDAHPNLSYLRGKKNFMTN